MNRHKISAIVLVIMLLCFFSSLVLYAFHPSLLKKTVFFFPHSRTGQLCSEVRGLPLSSDQETNAELIIQETLLGPYRHHHLRLFPRTAEIKSVLARKQILYINLTISSLFYDRDVHYPPTKALEVLKKILLYNINNLSQVIIAIEGQIALEDHKNKTR